jgi:mono/diheme cytochrome c family protein
MFKKLKHKFEEVDKDLGIDPRSDKLYAVTALFDTPDQIMSAATKVASNGYQKFDVHTPYPVHGMDDAMQLKPTKLGFFTFFFAALGTICAFLMIGYMVGIDYKSIIGGKPFFAIPPSMPIAFELTVLFGAVATIALTLFLFNKLPWINNPLVDTEYMRRVSSDKYGIIIQSKDPKFNVEEVVKLFETLGSSHVSYVNYFETQESNVKTPVFNGKFIGLLASVFVVVVAVTYFLLNVVIYNVPFDWMWNQARINPQTSSTFFADGRGMRTPVDGTVPRGHIPYIYKGLSDSAVKNTANPLPLTQEVLDKGKSRFNTYCSPCHGYYGKGDSRMNGQFPNPPSLHTDKVRNWADGNIYHVVMNGQNVMPSYAKQVSRDDIWAIIHYIRVLQRSQNASDADLEVK